MKFTIKWNRSLASLLNLCRYQRPKTKFFVVNAGAQRIVFARWFTYTTPSSHVLRESLKPPVGCVCSRQYNFFSNLFECVDFSDWYKFFRINNVELKCSFVRCRKYHKSWWNGAAELLISVDLLCGTTAAELRNSVDLLCGTTAAELRNSVDLLCGTTAPELTNPVSLMHAPGVTHIFQRQWRIMLKNIKA